MTPTARLGNTDSGPSDTKCEAVGLAPYRRMVRTRGRPLPRGRWPSPARPRTASRAAISPAFCVRRAADDGLAAHGWPGQRRPIRPLAASLASSCRMPRPWRAAGEQPPQESTTRCRLGAARRFAACCQAAAARPTPMAPPERTAALGTSTRAGVPPDRRRQPPVAR